jgi:hypothetical protein
VYEPAVFVHVPTPQGVPDAHSLLSTHVPLDDVYPEGQLHVYEPAVFVHVPTPHGVPEAHSLLSTHAPPDGGAV